MEFNKTKYVQTCARILSPSVYPTLCDAMDCSLPASSAHGILQARKWVIFPLPGDLPHPGVEPSSLVSLALVVGSLPLALPPGKDVHLWNMYRHIFLFCTWLYCASQILCSLQTEGTCQPYTKQVCWHCFPTAFAHFMTMPHFINCFNIPNIFIIITSVMVICGQWSLTYYYESLKVQMMASIL